MERDRRPAGPGLDPLETPAKWEELVSGIVAEARPELARRRAAADMSGLVLGWARPVLATAATVAFLVTGAALLRESATAADTAEAPLAGAVMPERYAAWLTAGYEPTVTELVVALEEFGR